MSSSSFQVTASNISAGSTTPTPSHPALATHLIRPPHRRTHYIHQSPITRASIIANPARRRRNGICTYRHLVDLTTITSSDKSTISSFNKANKRRSRRRSRILHRPLSPSIYSPHCAIAPDLTSTPSCHRHHRIADFSAHTIHSARHFQRICSGSLLTTSSSYAFVLTSDQPCPYTSTSSTVITILTYAHQFDISNKHHHRTVAPLTSTTTHCARAARTINSYLSCADQVITGSSSTCHWTRLSPLAHCLSSSFLYSSTGLDLASCFFCFTSLSSHLRHHHPHQASRHSARSTHITSNPRPPYRIHPPLFAHRPFHINFHHYPARSFLIGLLLPYIIALSYRPYPFSTHHATAIVIAFNANQSAFRPFRIRY